MINEGWNFSHYRMSILCSALWFDRKTKTVIHLQAIPGFWLFFDLGTRINDL
jgi:hypothetical protein